MCGDPAKARTLMRVAYRIMNADHDIQEREEEEFQRLCRLLDLDPESVWCDAAAAMAQAQDLGILYPRGDPLTPDPGWSRRNLYNP